eukprot:3134738-Pleurochrysis_carterae.AAC.1
MACGHACRGGGGGGSDGGGGGGSDGGGSGGGRGHAQSVGRPRCAGSKPLSLQGCWPRSSFNSIGVYEQVACVRESKVACVRESKVACMRAFAESGRLCAA